MSLRQNCLSITKASESPHENSLPVAETWTLSIGITIHMEKVEEIGRGDVTFLTYTLKYVLWSGWVTITDTPV
jgi:hypothetical protein